MSKKDLTVEAALQTLEKIATKSISLDLLDPYLVALRSLDYIRDLESRVIEGSEGHWTRDLVPEDGVYFYTTRHDDGSWTEPEKVYLVCDKKWTKEFRCSQLPKNQRRWSKKVPEWIPPLPKEDE
jgi:hypothetical protein